MCFSLTLSADILPENEFETTDLKHFNVYILTYIMYESVIYYNRNNVNPITNVAV